MTLVDKQMLFPEKLWQQKSRHPPARYIVYEIYRLCGTMERSSTTPPKVTMAISGPVWAPFFRRPLP